MQTSGSGERGPQWQGEARKNVSEKNLKDIPHLFFMAEERMWMVRAGLNRLEFFSKSKI